jgi:hypothetical protein
MIETECLSDLRLDELLVGERVPPAAQAHLAACGECTARRDELAADRARFLAAPPPLPAARSLPSPRRTRARLFAGGLAAMAAAAALLLFAAPTRRGEGGGERDAAPASDADMTRTKGGGARLGVIVEHRGAQRVGAPGETVHPGDTLLFAISTPRPTHVAVLGRDAHGRVSTYFPVGPAGSTAASLGAGPEQLLPLATVLDDSLGAEQLIAAFCERPELVTALHGALSAPPPGCTFDVFAIEKVP